MSCVLNIFHPPKPPVTIMPHVTIHSDEATSQQTAQQQQRILRRAMMDSDGFVVELEYIDSKGARTRRMVSPIRTLAADRFLGLCLCRQEPRQFQLSRCRNLRLVPAEDVLMPVEIVEIVDTIERPTVELASAS